ncbi:MAG: T9SS type A sorting domain-containing protein [Bacteroidota bacterium]
MRHVMSLRAVGAVVCLALAAALGDEARAKIIGFFPAADSISVIGSCTPPSLISSLLPGGGSPDTLEIRPMWDDRMYAGSPGGVQITRCFFLVVDSSGLNEYRLWLRELWPVPGTVHRINLDSTFMLWGCYRMCLAVSSPGSYDSAEVRFYADAWGAVLPASGGLPATARIVSSFPNPFNAATTIRFELDGGSDVRLLVRDLLGREVRILAEGMMPPGEHSVRLEAGELSSGVYFATLEAGSVRRSHRMILIR